MKFLSTVLTFAFSCVSHAEIRRVKPLDSIEGIEYIDVERVMNEQKRQMMPIRELVPVSPPTTGTAYRVRVVKWKPDGGIRAIWSYYLKNLDGNYEFQELYSSRANIGVEAGDSVLYYVK